ncbi:phage terminase small subunit [Vibrio sp. OPT18]|uniref:phage terminase small subunit n=1 Tax=Vibrio sp. OPT18 TaxID=2778641 RepID=UPI001882CF2A|nr:phage terminase small subunit [Vibrio sp. OPT18]MBE8574462.1 hypothetical protein [Vibrio sp. OPT18]
MFALARRRQQAAEKQVSNGIKTQLLDTHAPNETKGDLLVDKPWNEITHMLKQDLEYVRTLAGFEARTPFKKELTRKYRGVVAKLLSEHDNLDGLDIIWWWYQWQIDVGLLPLVHDDFRQAIERGLDSPQRWSSSGQTAYCDIIYKYSNDAFKQEAVYNPQYLMKAVKDISNGSLATNAALKVKMFRLVGDIADKAGLYQEALAMFGAVMSMDPTKGGRKTRLKELKEQLNHESKPEPSSSDTEEHQTDPASGANSDGEGAVNGA